MANKILVQQIKVTELEKKLLKEKAASLDIDVSKLLLWSSIYPERIEKLLENIIKG
jgi:hypothetical protein